VYGKDGAVAMVAGPVIADAAYRRGDTSAGPSAACDEQRARLGQDIYGQEAPVEERVGMIGHAELRLPEMQRQYVWRCTRVRGLDEQD
jgi:hypothetical protein